MSQTKSLILATALCSACCAPVRATQTVSISTADNEYRHNLLNQTSAYYAQDSPPVGDSVGVQGGRLPMASLWAFSIPAGLPQVTGATLEIPYGTFLLANGSGALPGTPTPYDTLSLSSSIETIAQLFSGHSTLNDGQPWPGNTGNNLGSVLIYPGGDPASYVTITLNAAAVNWINQAVPGMPPEGNFGRGGDGWLPVVGFATGTDLALSGNAPAILQLTVVPEPTTWLLGLMGAALLWLGRRYTRAKNNA
jgi:hypothetical protein